MNVFVRLASYFRKREAGRALDSPLLHWTQGDPFTSREFVNGGVTIFGRTGSGKTSFSGCHLARNLIGQKNNTGLICGAKPEDREMWLDIFAKEGRADDLVIMSPGGDVRMNLLAEAARYGADAAEITECITTIGDTLRNGKEGNGTGNAAFFKDQERIKIHHAVVVLRMALSKVTAVDLQDFISMAATSPEQLTTRQWQEGFHSQCLEQAHGSLKTGLEAIDYHNASIYWCLQHPKLARDTRTCIDAGVAGTLFAFNTGSVRDLVATETTVTFDGLARDRKWLFVDMPPTSFGESGVFVNAGLKYLAQKWVLKRHALWGDPMHTIWSDEAQLVMNEYDAKYLAQSRSHLGCMVFLSQSLPGYYAATSGERGKAHVDALLANFGTRIFHSLGDHETAQWASNFLGKRLETFVGGSMQPRQDMYDAIMGNGQYSTNFSTHYENILQPSIFMSGLRNGEHGFCDAIVMRPGKTYSNGENWLLATFTR